MQATSRVDTEIPTPVVNPNGLQWVDEELFIMDQETDDVAVVDDEGHLLRRFETPTENGSGITVGAGYLWTASNGTTAARPFKNSDTHVSAVLQLDLETGDLVARHPIGDTGIHGIEWDDDRNMLWYTATGPKQIVLVDALSGFREQRRIQCELVRLHGLAIEDDGIWCAHTTDNVLVHYDIESGAELNRITMGPEDPFVHGLTIRDEELWFADANFAGKNHTGVRGRPAIGTISR